MSAVDCRADAGEDETGEDDGPARAGLGRAPVLGEHVPEQRRSGGEGRRSELDDGTSGAATADAVDDGIRDGGRGRRAIAPPERPQTLERQGEGTQNVTASGA